MLMQPRFLFTAITLFLLFSCGNDTNQPGPGVGSDSARSEDMATGNGVRTAPDTIPGPPAMEPAAPVGKSPASWTAAEREIFIKGCMDNAVGQLNNSREKASGYCNCMLEKLQQRYAVADSARKLTIVEGVALSKSCLPEK